LSGGQGPQEVARKILSSIKEAARKAGDGFLLMADDGTAHRTT
jgi:hypothetical protein